jgi:hypothetical protein
MQAKVLLTEVTLAVLVAVRVTMVVDAGNVVLGHASHK